MSINPQVLVTAKKMIERYGSDAGRQVEERIAELNQSEKKYEAICENWKQVLLAISALLESSSNNTRH
jgi:hypothetical protein